MVAAMLAKKRPTSKHYKSQQHKPTSNKAGKVKLLCWKHAKFGEDALNCADKKTCTWSENKAAGKRWPPFPLAQQAD